MRDDASRFAWPVPRAQDKFSSEPSRNLLCASISVLKQNKLTLWDLGEEISGNGISTIGKCKFTILQN